MHILYFHQHFSTPSGATGTRSYEMAQKLISKGHAVTMVCGSYNVGATGLTMPFEKGRRRGDVNGIDVIEFDLTYANTDGFLKRSWQFILFAMHSVKIALTHKYDLLFATSTPLTASIPGIFAALFKRKKFVFEVRDLWPELPKAMGAISNPVILGGMSVLEKVSYRMADACIGLSPGIVDGIKRRSRDSLPVSMIPNGCDLAFFSQPTQAVSLPFEKTDDQLVACFTGAHGMANGLDNVLDAAAILHKSVGDKVLFLFVGEGKEKAHLQERVKTQGLTNCIFMDAMPKHNLVSVLHQSDVGLMPLANVPAFYYGTSPNKFFDYLSCGLPIVNNYPGWLADMIQQHDIGLAVAPDDAQKLADALLQLANDKGSLPAMGQRARELAEREFDRDRLSDQFLATLEEAAK